MAINRATQNWPEGTAHVVVPAVSPYAHELNIQGTQCAVDCPACTWVAGLEPADGSEPEVERLRRLR